MKIALLSRPDKAVNKNTTSSRPRVIYDLANGLTKNGHRVTIFGSGDSIVPCELEAIVPVAIETMSPVENPEYRKYSYVNLLIERTIERSVDFDMIHNHLYPEFIPLLAAPRFKAPLVTTIHTQILPYMNDAFSYYRSTYFVALSQRQRFLGSKVNFIDVVYNGIDVDNFIFNDRPDDYLLFFGRMKSYVDEHGKEIDPKGVTKAIEVAQETDQRLYIAGNIEDPQFFEYKIKPHLSEKIKFIGAVSSIGSIGPKQKSELYRNAKALLNPIDWEEPFGLVMVEAMACGTPVISFDRGAASEVIDHQKTGFIVKSLDEMATAISRIDSIDRAACRQRVDDCFTVDHMTADYEKVYRKIVSEQA